MAANGFHLNTVNSLDNCIHKTTGQTNAPSQSDCLDAYIEIK
jgi:hypothetical protein